MSYDLDTPFESIEGAQEYLALMVDAIKEAKQSAEDEIPRDRNAKVPRRLEALRLVLYKLEKLDQHIKVSRRLLNDLRTLRRLLFEERGEPVAARSDRAS